MNSSDNIENLVNRLDRLEADLNQTKSRLDIARRRLRATWLSFAALFFGFVILASSPTAQAQFGITLASLNSRLLVVENKTASMTNSTIDTMNLKIQTLESKTLPLNYDNGTKLLTVSGANVRIVDGSGGTISSSGLGNLQIGYNEARSSGNLRTGSHNLILGTLNNYVSSAGIISGEQNEITAQYACVIGAKISHANGANAVVIGGENNYAIADTSAVTGGRGNQSRAQGASVTGGDSNYAMGNYSSISGGTANTITGNGTFSSITGGAQNRVDAGAATVTGGTGNQSFGAYSSVSGGYQRVAPGNYNWVGGSLFQSQ